MTNPAAVKLAQVVFAALTLCPGAARACQPFPSGLIPFSSISYVTAARSNGDRLVVGYTTQSQIALVPLPNTTNDTFCDSTVQLAPGQYFSNVYVPTAAERFGDNSGFPSLLYDPLTGLPFPAGIIPASRLYGLFAWRIGPAAIPSAHFVPVTPCRVADTRNASGAFGGPSLAAGERRDFTIPASACGIPSSATAYSFNVTAVPSGPLGYLTLAPTGKPLPLVSTLNSPTGSIAANAAIVPAGGGGSISVYATDRTHVILDINGYFSASDSSALYFYPATPCRIADTRNATGAFGGPSLAAGVARTFNIPSSSCGIPSTARAFSLNFTVVPRGSLGYLSTWPTGGTQPLVSTLNSPNGAIRANAAIVPAGTGGGINVYATDVTDLVIDVNGYFGPAGNGGYSLYAIDPCRVSDTRNANGALGGPIMIGGSTRTFPVASSACSVPSNAVGFSLNVTVVPSVALGYLTLWPAGGTQPLVSTLNALDGAITANSALVPAGTSGGVSVFVLDTTHVILDLNGYFAP
jgi:hypothetical protein